MTTSQCSGELTFTNAAAFCEDFGARLCTLDEIVALEAKGTGCSYDNELVWTVPLVVFGLFRYLLLVQRQEGGGSPTRVLLGGDLIFVINALLWGAMVLGCLFL